MVISVKLLVAYVIIIYALGSVSELKSLQNRFKVEIPGRARREERLSRSKLKWAFLRPGSEAAPLIMWRQPNWIRSDFGATLVRQLIQTAYHPTFISCMEQKKGLDSIPSFNAIIDFHFVEHHSSCFCRSLFLPNSFESLHSTFSCSSITSRKHGSQYATELPASQPLKVWTFVILEDRIMDTEVSLPP